MCLGWILNRIKHFQKGIFSIQCQGKLTKVAEAKEVLKRNVKANKKITFNDEAVATDSKSASKDVEEEDDTGSINWDKAKERYQEEDKFDKEEYKKKIKAKHQERQLKEREARR